MLHLLQIFEYKPVLDKVKATHGLAPVDTTAARLFKRPRPAFLSAEAGGGGGGSGSSRSGGRGGGASGDTTPRFHARPAARAPGAASSAAAVAAAAAAATASAGGARKRGRDGKSLAFGAGLVSRGGAGPSGSRGLPTTLAAIMDLAGKEPAEFARVSTREGKGGGGWQEACVCWGWREGAACFRE